MQSSFSTQDLRAGARDCKRDFDNQHKWENGEAWGPGRLASTHSRPAKHSPYASLRESKLDKQSALHRAKANRRRDIVYDTADATDSSADEATEPSAAPEPDADVTYSYDAERGPSHGSQVLGYALEQAVERFETKETEKLVKNEYLILDTEGEPVAGKANSNKKAMQQTVEHDEEDEYEFL